MADREKTIDGFAYWIDNEENGVCHIPLNLCKKVLELLKEQCAEKPKSEHHLFICPICKNALFRGQKYCHECGKPIEWDGEQE